MFKKRSIFADALLISVFGSLLSLVWAISDTLHLDFHLEGYIVLMTFVGASLKGWIDKNKSEYIVHSFYICCAGSAQHIEMRNISSKSINFEIIIYADNFEPVIVDINKHSTSLSPFERLKLTSGFFEKILKESGYKKNNIAKLSLKILLDTDNDNILISSTKVSDIGHEFIPISKGEK